jgi:hypothetical protein
MHSREPKLQSNRTTQMWQLIREGMIALQLRHRQPDTLMMLDPQTGLLWLLLLLRMLRDLG